MTVSAIGRSENRAAQKVVGHHGFVSGAGWDRQFPWCDPTRLGSAAFWVEETAKRRSPESYRIGSSLSEEVAFCLLGGFGITETMAVHAFTAIRDAGLFDAGGAALAEHFEAVLRRPMVVPGHHRAVRYRFPRQRAVRLSAAMSILARSEPPSDAEPRRLRDWLMVLPGVGPKTASWIVRNRTRSDSIAVIDIHIRRAGVVAGVFDPAWRLPRDYHVFEEAFCGWASLGGVPTAELDATIWSALSALGNSARLIFGVNRLTDLD